MAAEMPPTTYISAQVLNTALLRSANFYEAQCFKSMVYARSTQKNDVAKCSIF